MYPELKFDRNRKRVKFCPCGKHNRDGKFSPYFGYDNKGYCFSCGETFLPNQNTSYSKPKEIVFAKPRHIDYHDRELISKYGRNFKKNNFIQFLKTVFSVDQVSNLIQMYCLGTIDKWDGANIFWQIDNYNHVRHGKVMLYDHVSGKRKKTNEGRAYITSIRSLLELHDFNLEQCLFGLHLVNETKADRIALVEGEKTACIMSVFKPDYLWLATGSKQGFKYKMLKSIKDWDIVAFPDKGEYHVWVDIASELNSKGFNIKVSKWLEDQHYYPKGTDLADVYLDEVIKTDKSRPTVSFKEVEKNNEESIKLIPTKTESDVWKLAAKNPNILNLISAFDLTDPNGREIRESLEDV
ncbi:DUF6371 domain-containing protein [Robiginitalea aurantiaca]|uniref:DUF6371 domain-containing protein n=1 Tax=Robiginitalea aurantiaca TaxID=3056915 RepID=A0ABT7WBG0_9FLAO|nr:DUF6371 domain-containing protein [Robiginitalea aurantiaca]MDM9630254.1 DUF6371 domain-containing protein [Robiginitalea aurantiaca]